MKAVISVPGKTFLVGEYLALQGGPAILFTSEPRFELVLQDSSSQVENVFEPHPKSAAGIYYSQNENFFSRYKMSFRDPYHGKGGFGASSAQFALLHILRQLGDEIWTDSQKHYDFHLTYKDYRRVSGQDSQGPLPSGADVIAQLGGGLCYFEPQQGKFQSLGWPFSDLGLWVLATGVKVPTHEHLRDLKVGDFMDLKPAVQKAWDGLLQTNSQQFISSVNDFAEGLSKRGLWCESTQGLLLELKKWPGVVAAKGCGALGADTVILIFERSKFDKNAFQKVFLADKLEVRATEDNLSQGVQVHVR